MEASLKIEPEIQFVCSDNYEYLKSLNDNSVDSVVTDVPYGLGAEPDISEVMKAWVEFGYYKPKNKSGFMGKEWDAFVPQPIIWKEIYRVLKPGGHVIAFFGNRTYDLGVIAMRFAGFEIRDKIQYLFDDSELRQSFIDSLSNEQKSVFEQIFKNGDTELSWNYGQGFPKSLDVSKAIDEKLGTEREIVGVKNNTYDGSIRNPENHKSPAELSNIGKWGLIETPHGQPLNAPSSEEAKKYSGWGTALKPSSEPIVLARKPLNEKTVADNVIKYGTGGINIDRCRIGYEKEDRLLKGGTYGGNRKSGEGTSMFGNGGKSIEYGDLPGGRFPSNLILSHSSGCKFLGYEKVKGTSTGNGEAEVGEESNGAIKPIRRGKFTDRTDEAGLETVEKWECSDTCPVKLMDEQSGILTSGAMRKSYEYQNNGFSMGKPAGATKSIHEANTGGASRFYYVAKPSQWERNFGLDNFSDKLKSESGANGERHKNSIVTRRIIAKNIHPTVKPISLMRQLVRLITPPGGVCLDPYAGSGTTGIACKIEGFNCILVDSEQEYIDIAKARYHAWQPDDIMEIIREQEKKPKDDNQISLFTE